MEISVGTENMSQQKSKQKGGIKTMPFIMSNEVFGQVGTAGLMANMIMYLTKEYHMSSVAAASSLFIWGALSNFIPLAGATLADSYLGRFRVIAIGSIICLVGMILLWLTAMIPAAKPPACETALNNCQPPSDAQLALLFFGFGLMSIGSGGIRPCCQAFGADQFDKHDNNPQNQRHLQTFFNWYYSLVGVCMVLASTVILYIQENMGWKVGFGIPVVLMALSIVCFLLGSFFYIKVARDKSMIAGLSQVAVASVRNRKRVLPSETGDGCYHHKKDSSITIPTAELRLLNKACIIRNPEADLNADGSAANPWRLCTVEQVENLKALIRVLPMWSTGIMPAVIMSQQSFAVLQASSMDRHLGPNFEIPAASFNVFGIVTMTLWVAIYDRLVVPYLAKVTGNPRGLGVRLRMGIGLVVLCVAPAAAAIVESVRRRRAIEQGLADNAEGVVNMSALWLALQHCLIGLGEAFNMIGQMEFLYSEIPQSMASVGMALFGLGAGVGSLLGGVMVQLISSISASYGVSWLDNNLNQGHYDYYYSVLSLMGVVNFCYYLYCCRIYGEEGKNRFWEKEGSEEKQPNKFNELAAMDEH